MQVKKQQLELDMEQQTGSKYGGAPAGPRQGAGPGLELSARPGCPGSSRPGRSQGFRLLCAPRERTDERESSGWDAGRST